MEEKTYVEDIDRSLYDFRNEDKDAYHDRSETYTSLVAAQLDVGSIFLRRVEHFIERHIAYIDVFYISIVVGQCIDTANTQECAEVIAELICSTCRETIVILATVHITVEAVLAGFAESLV